MTKKELRTIYRQKRLALSATEKSKLDDLLLIQLQRLNLGNAISVIMSFYPLEQHGEMNTHLYTRYLEFAFPGVRITFPVVDFSLNEISAVVVTDDTVFIENKYGIPEPEEGEEIASTAIDLVLVPLLAFDKKGFRAGYGKGFYDRFLRECRPDVITVGFSYFEPVDEIEDTHPFDVPLNYCITPENIYAF